MRASRTRTEYVGGGGGGCGICLANVSLDKEIIKNMKGSKYNASYEHSQQI